VLEVIHDRAVEEGSRIYFSRLREELEQGDNIGKVLVIDVDSGEYELDDDGDAAMQRARSKHPDHLFYRMRIGARATYTMAGPPRRGH
jgi:hypothetical protein